MAMGVIQSAIGLFGNVPCPIIYGAVVDSACLIWKSVCGKHGACSLYDADTFRQYFLGKSSKLYQVRVTAILCPLQALRLALCFLPSSWIWWFGARLIALTLPRISRTVQRMRRLHDWMFPSPNSPLRRRRIRRSKPCKCENVKSQKHTHIARFPINVYLNC